MVRATRFLIICGIINVSCVRAPLPPHKFPEGMCNFEVTNSKPCNGLICEALQCLREAANPVVFTVCCSNGSMVQCFADGSMNTVLLNKSVALCIADASKSRKCGYVKPMKLNDIKNTLEFDVTRELSAADDAKSIEIIRRCIDIRAEPVTIRALVQNISYGCRDRLLELCTSNLSRDWHKLWVLNHNIAKNCDRELRYKKARKEGVPPEVCEVQPLQSRMEANMADLMKKRNRICARIAKCRFLIGALGFVWQDGKTRDLRNEF